MNGAVRASVRDGKDARSGACGRARRGVPSEGARERVRLREHARAVHRKAHAPSRVVVRGSIDESKPPMIDPKSENHIAMVHMRPRWLIPRGWF